MHAKAIGNCVVALTALAAFSACRSTADDPRVQIAELEDRRVARPDAWETLLTRGSEESRRRAARAVGRIRDAALTAALVRAVDVEHSDAVVVEQLFALGQIGDPGALDLLLRELESKTPARRAAAAEAIGKVGAPRVAPNLVAHLLDSAADVRGASALALARLVGRRAKLSDSERLDAEAQQRFLQACARLLEDRDADVRWKAAYALSEVDVEGRVAALVSAAASSAKGDGDWRVRFFAAAGLARAKGDDAAREAALERLAHDSNRQVVAAALGLATRSPDPTAPVARLLDQARHGASRYARVAAIRELARRFGDYDSIRGPLVSLASDPDVDVDVASEALDALANLARSSTTVASYAQDHSPADVAATKRELLECARRGVAAADLAVVGNAFDRRPGMDDAELRCDAIHTAAELGGKESSSVVDLLRRARRDESPAVAAAAKEEWKRLALADDKAAPRSLEGRPGADLDQGGAPSSVAIEPSADFLRSSPNPRVAFHFAKGDVVVELLREEAPRHVKMVLTRVRLGQCDGLPIHRVVPGFVVQGFDPRGDGWGNGGVFLRDEVNRVPFERGVVGMPNTGPDSGGCQLFFTLVPTPHLDGRYTVFGRVVAGMDVVDQLEVGDVCSRAEEVR
jgi:cyclophilin family peptidyl-prolyl cis-trans isomerase/HEAT repeat protein